MLTASLILNHPDVRGSEASGRASSQGPILGKGPCTWFNVLLSLSTVLVIFKQGAPNFHFTLDPANSVASPEARFTSLFCHFLNNNPVSAILHCR